MIVDASVVVKWFLVEELHAEALRLLTSGEPLAAPDILSTEFANVMWAKARRDEIDPSEARRAIVSVSGQGGPELYPSGPLLTRAFDLAWALDHPVYDCVYLALAQELRVPLVTADARFAAAARDHEEVRLLGADRG